jgi:hypothetical protein
MTAFIAGAMAMACCVIALFFLRFWRDTGDRLFALFSVSFFLLGFTRIGLSFAERGSDGHTFFHLARLLAFVLILVAVIDKNRR